MNYKRKNETKLLKFNITTLFIIFLINKYQILSKFKTNLYFLLFKFKFQTIDNKEKDLLDRYMKRN